MHPLRAALAVALYACAVASGAGTPSTASSASEAGEYVNKTQVGRGYSCTYHCPKGILCLCEGCVEDLCVLNQAECRELCPACKCHSTAKTATEA